ncbi:YitT family protein, partial [Intestinibacter sp.]|uniref:YitT family protein n=1 Tax=Intestinibacter sp. TaxID=1965304 RepID=UPI002A75D57A
MSKINKVIGKDIFFRYSIILTGMIISSIGINGFIRPAHLLSGGVTGLATMLNYITNINVGLLTFLINIPIFVLGFIYLEKDFCITSLINMVLFSFILGITQDIGAYININDILLQSAYGGILCGVGVGLTF